MTERELIFLESQIGGADAQEIAAIAFAALFRIGELGLEAAEAFVSLAEGAASDPDMIHFSEGTSQMLDVLRKLDEQS